VAGAATTDTDLVAELDVAPLLPTQTTLSVPTAAGVYEIDVTALDTALDTGTPLTVQAYVIPAATGADAVLTTVLVEKTYESKDGGSRDTRGTAGYKATGYELGPAYGYGPYSYGAYGVPVTVSYGEFVTTAPLTSLSSNVTVTSMLYEAKAGTPVYSVGVRAGDLHGRDSALATITPTIAGKLRQDGLVR
jgi:hypothetical protein